MIIVGKYSYLLEVKIMPVPTGLSRLNDFSAFLSLIAVILSIESTHLDILYDINIKNEAHNILIVSVFISACSDFIDLSTAKKAYDDLKNSKTSVNKNTLSAAEDLLTSRVFSVIADIYLIRATLKSGNVGLQEIATPTGIGGV